MEVKYVRIDLVNKFLWNKTVNSYGINDQKILNSSIVVLATYYNDRQPKSSQQCNEQAVCLLSVKCPFILSVGQRKYMGFKGITLCFVFVYETSHVT
jgi:membrane-associated HD superfamily phosphohydrolase